MMRGDGELMASCRRCGGWWRPSLRGLPREFHAKSRDALAHVGFGEGRQKSSDGRTGATLIGYQKIKMFWRDRQERQTVELRHIGDGDSPVGAALCDGACSRVMGFWLVGVTRRPAAFKQLVDQDTGPGACIAIDHQTGRISECGAQRISCGFTGKSCIVRAKHKALHT